MDNHGPNLGAHPEDLTLRLVNQLRDGDPRAGYVVLEEGEVEFRRVTYDAEAAAQAIRASDLPDYYADELLAGRELETAP